MAKRVLLTKREIKTCVAKHEGWSVNKAENQLTKQFSFNSYIDGLVFIARIAVHAEILNHHPVIEYTHDRVKVKLTTKAVKGLTQLDISLLERIEKLYSSA